MPQKYKLPGKITVPGIHLMDENQVADLVLGVAIDTVNNALPLLNPLVQKLPESRVEKILQASCEAQQNAATFMGSQLQTLAVLYVGYRTDMIEVTDKDGSGNSSISGTLGMKLNELSDLLGKKTTDEIFRTIGNQADDILEQRFGADIHR